MITEESINFLRKTPPFQFLDEPAIRNIAGHLSLEFFPKNTFILTQDGPPSDSLRIIKKGGVKVSLSNDDELVIDYKSEGDCFGYVSLISGDKSRTNVQAVEDTLCYQIPKEVILQIINTEPVFGEYFMKSFFTNFIDKTYKEMHSRNTLFKEGEKLLYTTPVKEIVAGDAVTSPLEISIKEASGIMSRYNISSLVLTGGGDAPVGIITDKDLREKVVAAGLDPLSPVREIMSSGLVTVSSKSTCFDALSTMIRHNIHHLVITEENELVGVVTNHDFMLLQGTSPLSILKNIDRQKSAEDLIPIRKSINKTLAILFKEGVRASHILRIITELHDRLIMKLIDLSIDEIGSSHCPFAFFVYGSEGRREETFKTVFHCAIVYDDEKTDCDKTDINEYCQNLIQHLQDTFRKCDLPLFDTMPLGEGVTIYGDISEWETKVITALRSRNNEFVISAKKMLDSRAVYGNEFIVEALKDRIYKYMCDNEMHSSILQDDPSKQTSKMGFFKKFFVDERGEQLETLDIKQKGTSHIVESLRAMAIRSNIHETSTIERLNILSQRGLISRDLKNNIHSAFEFMLYLLLQSQLIKKETNKEIDNFIEPENLSLLEKKTLKEVFQLLPALREKAKHYFQYQETPG
jgi:CBS domain-containing protein